MNADGCERFCTACRELSSTNITWPAQSPSLSRRSGVAAPFIQRTQTNYTCRFANEALTYVCECTLENSPQSVGVDEVSFDVDTILPLGRMYFQARGITIRNMKHTFCMQMPSLESRLTCLMNVKVWCNRYRSWSARYKP